MKPSKKKLRIVKKGVHDKFYEAKIKLVEQKYSEYIEAVEDLNRTKDQLALY